MKKLFFTILILGISTQAYAEVKAKNLLALLKEPRTSFNYGVGAGFVTGVYMMNEWNQLAKFGGQSLGKTSDGRPSFWPKTCLPPSVSAKQFREAWYHWAMTSRNFNPEASASLSLIRWAEIAYPCGEVY